MAPSTPCGSRARPLSEAEAASARTRSPAEVLAGRRTVRGRCPADERPEPRQRSGDPRDSTDDDEEHVT